MRCWRLFLLVSLSVVLLAGIAGPAQAIDPNDNFDDGVIDTTKWIPWPLEGSQPVETASGVVLTLPANDTAEWMVDTNLTSTWMLRGPFDIQVDYGLLNWPAHNLGMVGITLNFPGESDSTMRTSGRGQADDGTDEVYMFNYRDGYCSCDSPVATSDTAGKLRVTRDADSILTSYYWSVAANDWVAFNSRPVSAEDGRVTLLLWAVVPEPGMQVAFSNFQMNSGEVVAFAPSIEDVMIDRGRDTDWWDWERSHARFTIQVKGTEYEQPNCLLIEDMQGGRYVIPTCGIGSWYDPQGTNAGGSSDVRVTAGPDYTYKYTWYEARKPLPIPEGSYRIIVVGSAGSWPELVTPVVPAVAEEGPALSAPAAESVVDTTVPTFEWLSPAGWENTLQVRAEGATNYTGPLPEADDCGQIWRAPVGEQMSALYNFDGTGPDLDPGRTYFWQVNAWTPVDDRVTDPRISIWNEQTARHRFTVDTTWPALPALLGALAYEQTMYGGEGNPYNLQAILQYGTTPQERKWVGPDASHTPSYSWDGSKLAYRISDTAIFIANQDGSSPVQLPNMIGWDGAAFSPDASQITYADTELSGTPPLQIYTQNVDGSNRQVLVPARGSDDLYGANWSPDGTWISYLSCCDASGYNIWLIHPNGTGDHPLVQTSVAGHPGASFDWVGNIPVWSPDATRLGIGFSITTADGNSVGGIGTISREGGEIRPTFIRPPGYDCCAAANFWTWSPDGNSAVFGSAHHLPVDPEWANRKFEPGVELWMTKADGTGEPTRLTYDYSHIESAAWWAPNTAVGKAISIVKGDAKVTFAQVTAEGSTRINVTPDCPAPAPAGYTFTGDLWNGVTTAQYQGGITVALHYGASLAGRESSLALLQWDAAKGKWQDITTRPIDKANRVIRGQCRSLSTFAIAVKTR